MDAMTSRQRMLAALRRQEVDYVPCCPFFTPSLAGPQYTWKGRADSLDLIVNHLGLDALVAVGIEASRHPDVTEHVWQETVAGERWPILHKRFDTPAGPLTAAIYVTDDLEPKDDIPLISDYNASRYVKPWLENMADVERFRYVHMPPTDADIKVARERISAQKRLADEYGVITYAGCGMGLTAGLLLFGPTPSVMLSMDQPEVIERFLEIEHQTTMRRAEVLADLGVDVICRNGFYETTDFWNPRQLERWLHKYLLEEIEVMRSRGAVVTYTVETGLMPMLDMLAALPFDGYHGIEPVLGNQDARAIAAALKPRHSIWGGVSGPIHIGEGTPEIARQAVRDAFEVLGPQGLVLSAVPSIRAHWPWENALAMFDEWRKLRNFE